MTFSSLIHIIVLALLLLAVLVHVQSLTDQSEDIETPGLVHPVHQVLGVSVSMLVVVVVVVSSSIVPGLGL